MRRKGIGCLMVCCALLGLVGVSPDYGKAAQSLSLELEIDTAGGRSPISPYIYGTNFDAGASFWTARRLGGNRLTGYNWENNASNAGSDWHHVSDGWLTDVYGIPSDQAGAPGGLLTRFHETSLGMGAYTLLTLQMVGYVAKDKNGSVAESETAPSTRWAEVRPAKGRPLAATPDQKDRFVYMDECVKFLVGKYGHAGDGRGVRGYALDNEPALWPDTHPRIHPAKTRCDEILARSIALADAVKHVDPSAEVFGPALYGFNAYYSFQDAPDWGELKGNGYRWFIDYYLEKMRAAEKKAGRRLIDVLDVHWYTEARGGGKRVVFEDSRGNEACARARVQAPRTLWDPTYKEDSWIAKYQGAFLPLLKNLRAAIDAGYPGTKLAVTEYCYGGEDEISGGIAMADALGVFGKYGVYLATYWKMSDKIDYALAAVRIFRDYDGKGSIYGDTALKAESPDPENLSVYASLEGGNDRRLHLMLINKHPERPLQVRLKLKGPRHTGARAWAFGPSSPDITERKDAVRMDEGAATCTVPPLTVCHVVLTGE